MRKAHIIFGGADPDDGARVKKLKELFNKGDMKAIVDIQSKTPFTRDDLVNGLLSAIIYRHLDLQTHLLSLIEKQPYIQFDYDQAILHLVATAIEHGNADVLPTLAPLIDNEDHLRHFTVEAAGLGQAAAWTILSECIGDHAVYWIELSLQKAAQNGHAHMMEVIGNQCRASPKFEDVVDQAIEYAMAAKHLDCVHALRACSFREADRLLVEAAKAGFGEGVRYFLDQALQPQSVERAFLSTEEEGTAQLLAPHVSLDIVDKLSPHYILDNFHYRIIATLYDKQHLQQATDPYLKQARLLAGRKM